MKACTLRRYAHLAVLVGLCMGTQLQYSRAQVSTSGLNGVVSDTSGAVVPNAKVTCKSTGTGFSRTAVTDASGNFSISNLKAGAYDITVEAPGFKTAVVPNVKLYVGQTASQNITLEVGALREEVTVSAQAPLLNVTSGHVGTVVPSKLLTELPLNGRNFLQLNLLSPGVTRSKNLVTADIVDINPSSVSFSVNGQRGDNNLYLLDGTIFKDYVHGTAPLTPSVDAVQEFQTTTSNYSAGFGSEAAAQVNLVTKSGTNHLHATAWEYLRNDKLDARNFFQKGKIPPFRRNQFGFNVGGPVVLPKIYNGKDKSFFFFNYEGFRQVKSVAAQGNFPTPTQLSGDLSSLVTPGTPLVDPLTGLPFPGNVIPQNRMPSTLLPFLQNGIGKGPWIPVPNSTVVGANYFRNIPSTYTMNQYVVRGDHKIGAKTYVYGHAMIDSEFASNAGTWPGRSLNPNWSYDNYKAAHSITGHLTRTISPNLLFDFGFGWSGFTQKVVSSTAGKFDITRQLLKIQNLATHPGSWGAPIWSVPGYSNLGGNTIGPRRWPFSIFQYTPAMNLIKGKHNVKWGTSILRHHYDFQEGFYPNGLWVSTGAFTGYPLGDFLLGVPQVIVAVKNVFAPAPRAFEFGPYFQDDWKVTPNLTLNFGLRYDWTGFPYSSKRTFSNVYFGPNNAVPEFVTYDDARPLTFEGVTYPFVAGIPYRKASEVRVPKALVFNSNRNFAPRFGFAYRVPGSSSTVLRGGYGIYYQRDVLNEVITMSLNPPFIGINVIVNDPTNIQNFSWFDPFATISPGQLQMAFVDMNVRPVMVQQWNLTLERSIWNTLFSAAYVGNVGHGLPTIENLNDARPGTGAIADRRRWPTVGPVGGEGFGGSADYHSLQLRVQRDFSKGFALIAGYTWGKSIDDTGGGGVGDDPAAPPNVYDRRGTNRGVSGQDLRHRLVVSYVYELPFGKGKTFLNHGGPVNVLLGGWQVSGISIFSTGSPLTVGQVFNGSNTDAPNRPDLIGNPNGLSHSRPRGEQLAQWFDTSAFRRVDLTNGPYRFGNAGRHVVIGPGTNVVDCGLYKNFNLTEALKLQFRAEAFNLLNRPDFAQPGATLGTAQFGRILGTRGDARDIQLALRLTF